MDNLKEKYNVNESFYNKYFKLNAELRYAVELLQFLYFKKGSFLNPKKKQDYIEQYIIDEFHNFYDKNEINIPQITFCITSKCTLKCRDCGSLIPEFNSRTHINMSIDEFKFNLDKITTVANKIRRAVLLGGEPFIHPNLDEMINLICSKSNIDILEIMTNGTKIPNKKVLDVLKKYNTKVYVYISNYSENPALKTILKNDNLKRVLKEYSIKIQMVETNGWLKEFGFGNKISNPKDSIFKYNRCHCSHCTQIFNNKLYPCSKGSSAIELGLINVDDYVDLKKSMDLQNDIINYFKKDYFKACETCILSDIPVMAAIQK